jgi:sugar phosphate isomerase/epimerase
MKLAFMSSVCPKMTLKELLAVGEQYGYQGIEFRPEWGHGHGIELGATAAQCKEIARILADSPLDACALSPGVKFAEPEAAQRDAQFDTLCRYVQLAAKVGIGRIRVFGDPLPNDGGRAACYAWQAEYLARAAAEAGKAGVTIVLETHMNFRAFDAGEILYRTGYPPALRVNWHLGHCLGHGEDVDEAYRHVKGRVSHAHFSFPKEAAKKDPIPRQAELLAAEGYDGFFSVEIIDPENPQEVLASHAKGWKKLCRELGIQTAR